MRPTILAAAVVCAGLAVGLSACGGRPDPILKQAFGFQCGDGDNPLCHTKPAGEGGAQVSRYCYATIADSNCLDRPDPERKNQALGSSGY